jgi:hypothetical protein
MRQKLEFTQKVTIPNNLKLLFWDCPDNTTFLEKYIKRVLDYGNFEEIKFVFHQYPKETFHIAMKYKDIRRGVKFWIKEWNNILTNS